MRTFNSLGAFAAFLRERIATAPRAEHRAIDAGSKLFLDKVREIPGGHETPDWPALADATVADRERRGFSPDEPLLRTGAFAESFERVIVDHRHAVIGSDDPRAPMFEYGTSRMPPRPVVQAAEAQVGEQVAHVMAQHVHRHLLGHDSAD